MMRITLISLVCAFLGTQTFAQNEVRSVLLNECIAIATTNSPAIQAAAKKKNNTEHLKGLHGI